MAALLKRTRKRRLGEQPPMFDDIPMNDDSTAGGLPLPHLEGNRKEALPDWRTNADRGSPRPALTVAYGCVFIPVILVVWWMWTKRAAKRVVRTLLTYREGCGDTGSESEGGTEVDEAEYFQSWDDVMEQQQNSGDHSLRFVRWIKGKNHRKRTRMNAITRQILGSKRPPKLRSQQRRFRPDLGSPILDTSQNAATNIHESGFPESVMSWQCIDDFSGVELCPADDFQELRYVANKVPVKEDKENYDNVSPALYYY